MPVMAAVLELMHNVKQSLNRLLTVKRNAIDSHFRGD
jgi:hypothetical protein